MYYTYVLQNRLTKQFYIGYAADLKQRLAQHQRKQKAQQLIYYEAYISEKLARAREKKLKFYGSAWSGLKKRIIN